MEQRHIVHMDGLALAANWRKKRSFCPRHLGVPDTNSHIHPLALTPLHLKDSLQPAHPQIEANLFFRGGAAEQREPEGGKVEKYLRHCHCCYYDYLFGGGGTSASPGGAGLVWMAARVTRSQREFKRDS